MRNVFGWIRDVGVAAAGATGGVTATEIAGSALTAPGWLIAIGQAAVVVTFTVYAIDRRMARLHKAVNETRGELEMLTGKFNALSCVKDPVAEKEGPCC